MLVQQMRLQKGWSQEQLADLSGLNVRTIQRIESGRSVSVESFKALGAAFNVDFSLLQEDAVREITTTPEQTEVALAFGRMRRMQDFYHRLLRFCMISGFLIVADLLVQPRLETQIDALLWIIPTIAIWGLLVFIDGMRTFELLPWHRAEWEKRKVEKLLGREL